MKKLALLGSVLLGSASCQAQSLAKFEPPGDGVYHGASLPQTWSEGGLNSQFATYKQVAGKRLSVVTWFASAYEQGRMTDWRQNYAAPLARVKRLGALSLIKFSTQDYAYEQTKRMAPLQQIASGTWDAYFQNAAIAVKDFGGPVFISIDHEMNGTWYPYSQAYAGTNETAADFVAAWRRIVDVFRRNGANNAAFVWSPNVPDVGGVSSSSYYPGDNYTDWIGVSFYSGNSMSAMDGIYRTYAAKKPFFVTEWATAPEKSRYYNGYPGDAQWIAQFFAALTSRFPRVKAISWFQWDKEDGNYLLQRVPDQSKTYSQNIAAPRYIDAYKEGAAPINAVERPRLDNPTPEIVLTQRVPLERAPVQKVPVQKVPRERIKLQILPTR